MDSFEIGVFSVDVKRCQISGRGLVHSVEPKVMDVLVHLYRHRGEVVSQEAIFTAVWPKAIFNASSVQRCIAILRKALDEDAKNPVFIVTHPKRGYSLQLSNNAKTKRKVILGSALFLLLVVMGVVAFFQYQPVNKIEFSSLRPLGANDSNDFAFVLSADGKFAAFIRQNDGQKHIWIKHLKSGQETQLTSKSGEYTSLGWSPDGKSLAVASKINNGSQLVYLNLAQDTHLPINQKTVYLSNEYLVTSPRLDWSSNHTVYFTEKQIDKSETQLASIDMINGQKQVLHQSQGQDWLLMQSLAPDNSQIALGFEAGQNTYRIDLLNLRDGTLKTLKTIEDGLAGLSWHPDGAHLLLSRGQQVLSVALNGDIEPIAFKNYQYVRNATYSMDGNEIMMELVNVDVDIVGSTRDSLNELTTLVDTTSLDFLPVYSPDSSKFVFESHRFGLKQLFLYDHGHESLLFENLDNDELFGVAWSKNSKEIYTASKNAVFRIDIATKQVVKVEHNHHSFYLREAFNHADALLVSYRADDGTTFNVAKFDLNTHQLIPFEASGERLSCYSMSLDDQDNVYFSNNSQVFRLNQLGEVDKLWQSGAKNGEIIGVTNLKNTLFVTLEQETQYTLVEYDLLLKTAKETLIGNKEQKMLINAAHDYSQFLFLTQPKRKISLVRLK